MKRILIIALCVLAVPAMAETMAIFGFPLLPFTPSNSTVSSLPVCNAATSGTVFRVTDALLPVLSATVNGGGAVAVIVRCNGTNWIVGA